MPLQTRIRRGAGAVLGAVLLFFGAGCGAEDLGGSTNEGWEDWGEAADSAEPGNTQVSFGGAQDFGYFRALIAEGIVPRGDDLHPDGFFAEHYNPLPEAACGEKVCLQAMVGGMENLIDGNACTIAQVSLNSPLDIAAMERPPLSLTLVVDTSGSMGGENLEYVKEGLASLLNELYDEDELAIVEYNTGAEVLFAMDSVAGKRNALAEIIEGLQADGGTNLYAGLERGFDEASASFDTERQNRVLLLSDGMPTVGKVSNEEIFALAAQRLSEGVGISTIGLGTAFNEELMRGISEQGDGNFYFLENVAAVEEVFQEEVSYFTVPIATDLSIDVVMAPEYSIANGLGSSLLEFDGEGASLSLPSVFLAHRESDDDNEAGRRGGGSGLVFEIMSPIEDDEATQAAVVSLAYTDPETDERITEEKVLVYAPGAGVMREQGFFETDAIEKTFVMMNLLVGFQQGCDAFWNGSPDEALLILARVHAAVSDYNEEIGDADLEDDLLIMETLMGLIESEGAQEPPPGEIPVDPWPAD